MVITTQAKSPASWMIDLHCHLLPGVDDGPRTLEESLALCRVAVEGGTTRAIVTPHIYPGRWDNNKVSIARETRSLQHSLAEHDIPLELGFAGEVRLTDQIMRQVDNEEIPFYGEVDGYRVMLLEFPHGHIVPGSEKLIGWLMGQKIRPLVAHPERNREVMKKPGILEAFLTAGCWLQITAGSLCGDFGQGAQTIARFLLQKGVVTVVASDGHNLKVRRPSLKPAFDYLREAVGEHNALALVETRPELIVQSQFGGREVCS